ncbi:MAG: RagB/SusD family nutrient uptake outer membrane protein [Dysgonamonadaceae bacterium]|jgi:hypothetical protein|nr:RagB/SusD family nutrient uptake outer membrane protein [Dysgonamonadaceae bacterium]
MKKIFFITTITLSVLFSSCKFEFEPQGVLTGATLTDDNLSQMTEALYAKVWFDFNDKFYFGLGDGMSYNLYAPYSDYVYPFSDLMASPATGPLNNAWASLYVVAQQANKVMTGIKASSVADDLKIQYIAEARFMRGLAYWYLGSLWEDVVISEDPQKLIDNPLANTNPQKDVFEFALRDMEYAAKYLPETSAKTGHVNRYSAFGMLSRMYLHYAGFVGSNYGQNRNSGQRDAAYLDLAKKAAEKVISSGIFSLMPNYPDLFTIENNNNVESMFAFQWTPGQNSTTGYGLINTHQAYFALGSIITGDDAAWGGWTRCPYDMIQEYELNDTIRRKATWMGFGDYYPEINKEKGGLRIGNGDGEYNSGNNNQALNVKKGVVGSAKDNPAVGRMNSALDNYMLRYAEVLFNYADAVLGNNASTNDPTALGYFNAVRTRAGLNPKTSISYEDLRHERRVEFCMEGRYWYDLLARSYYKQQEVIEYINNIQKRGEIPAFLFNAPNNLRLDSERNAGTRAVATATSETFRLPYPESESIQNPKLKEAPIPFEFTEDRITDLFN